MPTISKMNKKQLYEYCKTLQEENKTHQFHNNDLEDTIKMMKEDIETQMVCENLNLDLQKKMNEEIEKLKKYNEEQFLGLFGILNDAGYCPTSEGQIVRSVKDIIKENKQLKSTQISCDCMVGGDCEGEGNCANGMRIKKLKDEVKELKKQIEYRKNQAENQRNCIIEEKAHYIEQENAMIKDHEKLQNQYEKQKKLKEIALKNVDKWEKKYVDNLHKIYVVNHETGEITDKTILSTYKTPKYREWRRDNLQARILAEGSDDDSDLQVIDYIKCLESGLD